MGLKQAGFDVTGVDITPQKNYPFAFIQADALTVDLSGYDLIWASPPCQAFTRAQKIRGRNHPDLIQPIRNRLKKSKIPYVIENVVGAPLDNPIMLCGLMFTSLEVYRHRLFETSFHCPEPRHDFHVFGVTKMGRPPRLGEFMHVVGNFSGVKRAQKAMGINWMARNEMSEAIPPAYSKYIAEQFLKNRREATA